MTFQNYKATNLAKWRLLTGIGSSTTSMVLESWQGDLFPDEFPFLLKIEKYDPTSTLEIKPVTKREIVKVTNKASDTFTIVRSAWYCPESDTATEQTNTAFDFSIDDYVFLVNAAEDYKDIKDEIVRIESDKLDISDYISWSKLYAESSTWTDAYAITLSDITSLINWMRVFFEVDVENTGSATLNVNWTGAKDIKLFWWNNLQTWYIKAWQIVQCAYDLSNNYWELLSIIDTSSTITTSNLLKDVELWEDIVAWDWKGAVFYGYDQNTLTDSWIATTKNIWNTEENKLVLTKSISNNVVKSWIIEWFITAGSPTTCTATFFIDNTNKTLSLSNAQLTSDFDLAELYFDEYWEYLLSSSNNVGVVITLDTISTSNFYIANVTESNEDEDIVDGNASIVWFYNWWIEVYWAWFTVSEDQDWMLLSQISWTWRRDSAYISAIKYELNWVEIFQHSLTSSDVLYSDYLNIFLSEWDKIRVYSFLTNYTHSSVAYWTWLTYSIDWWITNQTILDWLDSDKVWLSDIRYNYTCRFDWVVIESGSAWENKTMVTSWLLNQTSATPNTKYYLDNDTYTDRWEFSTTKNATYQYISIWEWKTTTGIRLWSVWFLDTIDLDNNTIYQAVNDWFVNALATGWTSRIIEWYADDVDWTTKISSDNEDTSSWDVSIMFPVKVWQYYKVYTNQTLTSAKFYPLS